MKEKLIELQPLLDVKSAENKVKIYFLFKGHDGESCCKIG
jgi:hypothetical protein